MLISVILKELKLFYLLPNNFFKIKYFTSNANDKISNNQDKEISIKSLKLKCPIQYKLLGKKVFLTFQISDTLLTDILCFITFIFTLAFKCLKAKFF